MSNGVNSKEVPGNIINNILGMGKLVPSFNKPLPSKDIPFLYIQPFQDLVGNLAPCESVL